MNAVAVDTPWVNVLGILAGVSMFAFLWALWRGARLRAQNRRGRIASAIDRYIGPGPGTDATKLERLIWVRRLCLKIEVPSIAALLLSTVGIDQTWLFVAASLLTLLCLVGLIDLSLAIRRERVS